MDGLKISQVADRTGIAASALRFYEQAGIVTPDRSPNGYRSYSPEHVNSLRFITRSKAVGLTLDEIAELLELRTADRCAPLQDRLAELVTARLADATERAAELTAFAAELETLLGTLATYRPDGPCDDDCGCLTTDKDTTALPTPEMVTLTRRTSNTPTVESCTLERSQIPARLDEWRRLLHSSEVSRSATEATIALADGTDLGDLASLIAAETECCSFFTFELHIDSTGRRLHVSAPVEQQTMIDLLVGAPS